VRNRLGDVGAGRAHLLSVAVIGLDRQRPHGCERDHFETPGGLPDAPPGCASSVLHEMWFSVGDSLSVEGATVASRRAARQTSVQVGSGIRATEAMIGADGLFP
jgi:hypothetical protein